MSKKKIIIITIIVIATLLISYLIYNYAVKTNTLSYEYKIEYHDGTYSYDIIRTTNEVKVIKKVQPECIEEPCNPIKQEEYNINFSEDKMIEVYSLFDELLIDKETKEVVISQNTLPKKLQNIIDSLINNDVTYLNISVGTIQAPTVTPQEDKKEEPDSGSAENTKKDETKKQKEEYKEPITKEVTPIVSEPMPVDSLTYEIIGSSQQSGINARGYTEKYINGKYSLVITMGKKSTGGNSISISSVNVNGDNVTIYVTEKTPRPNENVIQVITTPGVTISFSKKPTSFVIKNAQTGEVFNKAVDDTLVDR